MLALIAFIGPSLIGVKLLDYFNKGLSFKNSIYYFAGLLVFSSMINCVIAYLLFEVNYNLVSNLNAYEILFVKYTLVSIVINVILSLIIVVFQKNVSFTVEVEDVKSNSKNKGHIKKKLADRKKSTKKNKNK